ncbi:MAG: methyltransferase, FxLD system [Xenococcaceae cyanobacterium]
MEPLTPLMDESNGSVLHQALVDRLKQVGCIRSPRIEAAFRAVPRHLFLPGVMLDEVYCDQAIPIKYLDDVPVSSSSQPAIMAIMLEQLQVKPGQRVLEIGTGSGYNAALLAHLVGDTGQVVTIDLDEEIVQNARRHLASSGCDRVQVVCADGSFGYPSAAPFDRILLTVGAWDIAPAWWEQLHPDGRLVLPLSLRGPQVSVAFKQTNGHLVSTSVVYCGFMPLRGDCAKPSHLVKLGPHPGLTLEMETPPPVDAETLYGWLTGPCRDLPAPIQVTLDEIMVGLRFWLALQQDGLCELNAEGDLAERELVPELFRISSQNKPRSTLGLLGETSLCALMGLPAEFLSGEESDIFQPFTLWVRSFGSDETLATQLIEQIVAWDSHGRPSLRGLRLRAYKQGSDYAPSVGEAVIDKRWTRLVLDHPYFRNTSVTICN